MCVYIGGHVFFSSINHYIYCTSTFTKWCHAALSHSGTAFSEWCINNLGAAATDRSNIAHLLAFVTSANQFVLFMFAQFVLGPCPKLPKPYLINGSALVSNCEVNK